MVAHAMKEADVVKPADTIIFGEKKNHPDESPAIAKDYYMDLNEGAVVGGVPVGNDMDRVEHGCHSVGNRSRSAGGSNFAFIDSSVRYLKFGKAVWPLNQWAVNDVDRINYAFQP
jgi:hypothetical protein